MKSFCLSFSCIDRPGIIADVTSFLFEHQANVLHFQQFVEDGNFFCRITWESERNFSKEDFGFLRKTICTNFFLHNLQKQRTLGLFVSKNKATALEVFAKIQTQGFPPTKIMFVIGNDPSLQEIVKRHSIPFFYIPTHNQTIDAYEKKQLEIVQKFCPEFLGLARYMKVVSQNFIEQAGVPIINIHHSFLPSFVGANPYEEAYKRGVKIVGATSHFVTPELDQGPIIEQQTIKVRSGYSIADLKKTGSDIEKMTFAKALQKVLEYKVLVFRNRTIVFD